MANQGIEWRYTTAHSPWEGGCYEKHISTIKACLRKTIGKNLLSISELRTLVNEAAAVINSRPLTYLGKDMEISQVITPNHFMSLNTHSGPPVLDEHDNYTPNPTSAQDLLRKWSEAQMYLNPFWEIWRKSYVASLRERYQVMLPHPRVQSKPGPQPGHVVIVEGPDHSPRGSWKLGIITRLFMSHDGVHIYKVSI